MGNWCDNWLKVFGPEEDVARFKAKAVGVPPFGRRKSVEVLNFHGLLPVPEEVLRSHDGAVISAWIEENWGAGPIGPTLKDELAGYLVYFFDSNWSPATVFCRNIAPRWPTLTFILRFYSSASGFRGFLRIKHHVIEEECRALVPEPES